MQGPTTLVPCPSCRRHVFSHESTCPHCRTSGSSFTLAIAMATSVGLAACNPAPVYGPAPIQPDARTTGPTTEAGPAVPPTTVYGPAPIQPDERVVPAPPLTAPVPAPVYGPPPQVPDNRQPRKQPPNPHF